MLRKAATLSLCAATLVSTLAAQEGSIPKGIPPLDHVFVIMMENHGYAQILTIPNAPFITNYAKSANLAMNYFAVAHPGTSNGGRPQAAAYQLEFGRELEFFRARSGPPANGPVLQGQATKAYSIQGSDWQLFLFTSGSPEVPVSVVRKTEKARERSTGTANSKRCHSTRNSSRSRRA